MAIFLAHNEFAESYVALGVTTYSSKTAARSPSPGLYLSDQLLQFPLQLRVCSRGILLWVRRPRGQRVRVFS